ncbi:hypothetical protein F511_24151 [Dorcoceras hygrometricum]|uniref:Retrotransposon gag domain-containing protein n=1 Tax=Dorcoceras hygrometricum TaxID=472368 RepID=A0A2Z7BUQ3_9LAMI|nr:hypothetical protein F511_24151 [Dorcoceras hygrometricum]
MPPRRITNRQTEQGSTSTEILNAAATPMETLLKRFQSFKPPTLTGTESAIDCENWLEYIEQLFEALEYTDERRVKLIIHQLHGIGKSWWVATKKAPFKPPTLTGTESAIDCENWLEYIEQLFEALEYTDERRVKLIIHQLHGIGKSWWVF